MTITKTALPGIFILDFFSFKDDRGEFVKTIHDTTFQENGLEYQFTESFYSISKKDVIRGMHFQNPPHDHVKLVYVIAGSIIDVLIDLRSTSATFGQYLAVELSDKNRRGIYIDRGFAHGFLALENNTIVEYHTSTSQNKESEGGVLYNSFGFDWPVVNAIVSNRDLKHTPVSQFKTPF